MSQKSFNNYPDYKTPITDLLDASLLTSAAKTLHEGDLIALAWGNHTASTDKLNVRDVQSIADALRKNPLHGTSGSPVVGASCCCTCTPACCCTAAAVINA